MTYSDGDDRFHDIILYQHCCSCSLCVGQGVSKHSADDLALVNNLPSNSTSVSQTGEEISEIYSISGSYCFT